MSEPLHLTTSSVPGGSQELRRIGRNINGYFGETIDIDRVLSDCLSTAQAHGWVVQEINPAPKRLLAFTRKAQSAFRIYLSTGIHGDEPAGPLAALELLKQNHWPDLGIWLCPCLNPSGFSRQRRENDLGMDLNRDYREPKSEETRAHISWLQRQPGFDLCLCLHEDWESHGFYIYELNPDHRPSIAEAMVIAVSSVCPIDRSEIIEGRPAVNGLIRPNLDPRSRPLWPESFYLISHKSRLSYTLEAPSDFALSVRVAALVTAVNAAFSAMDFSG